MQKDEETLIQNQIFVHKLGTDQSEDKLIIKKLIMNLISGYLNQEQKNISIFT